ncbi:MAG: hypothetical protein JST53_14220 [Actinobacteria bacterium]|nr:hypothetical protein [Actinomycetota bacterium]
MSARLDATLCASAILIAATVALAGCGGDTRRAESETGSNEASRPGIQETTNPSPTGPVRVTRITDPARRAYVTRVDAVCRQVDPELAAGQDRVGNSADTNAQVTAYDDTIALGWRELGRIEAIPTPPGDGALLKANVFEPVRWQLELRERMSAALARTEVATLRRLRAELDNSTRALTGFARGYGFHVCGEA